MGAWSSDIYDATFDRWFKKELTSYEQAVLTAAIENVLEVLGVDICDGEWGKPLGGGLFEFRVRQSLHAIMTIGSSEPVEPQPGDDVTVLLRVFVTFHGDKVILLLHGLNKKADPSERRQNREIARARKLLKQWQEEQKRAKKAAKRS